MQVQIPKNEAHLPTVSSMSIAANRRHNEKMKPRATLLKEPSCSGLTRTRLKIPADIRNP